MPADGDSRMPPSDRQPALAGGGRPASAGAGSQPRAASSDDAVVCERCGAGMFRMHAVWRCPACGYKTDCCGW